MLCKYYWIVLYTVRVTVFSLGGRFFRTRCSLPFYLHNASLIFNNQSTIVGLCENYKFAIVVNTVILSLNLISRHHRDRMSRVT